MSGDKQRLLGYDVARAIAVFGMVVVNFKIVMGATDKGPDWLVTAVGLLDGRAAATFVILAGVGISLLSRRAHLSGDAALVSTVRLVVLKRALFLFVVGLLYTPIWPADILHFYGVYLAAAAFLLTATDRRLLITAVVAIIVFVVFILVFDYEAGWDWSTLEYHGLWTPAGMARHLFLNGFHPVFPWLAFLLYGMWLGRRRMAERGTQLRVLLAGVIVAALAHLASLLAIRGAIAAGSDADVSIALLGTAPMPPMPLYLIEAGGTATTLISLCLLATGQERPGFMTRVLAWTGQLALTLYVAHVVLGMGVLEIMGRLEEQTLGFALGYAALFCLASIVFAAMWRRCFTRGPLEQLMRAITG